MNDGAALLAIFGLWLLVLVASWTKA